MPRIVLIEDDGEIRGLIARSLARSGHDVETAANGLEGLEMVVASEPDLVVLDLGLPDIDGSELLRMIRAIKTVPIVVATARDDDETTIELLNAGADDYVVKPYSSEQLEARIRAVLRRTRSDRESRVVSVADLSIDVGSRVVTLGGNVIDLAPKEFDLLALMATELGTVVTKRTMLAEVWREPYGGSERTVDVHLSWLRKKLGETAQNPRFLQTVHGVGVKLVDPDA